MSKIFIVETVSMFKMRYAVRTENENWANDTVLCGLADDSIKELSQSHLDEVFTTTRAVSEEEYLRIFDEDNGYAVSWDKEKKLSFINNPD
jgi:hypothetical protein